MRQPFLGRYKVLVCQLQIHQTQMHLALLILIPLALDLVLCSKLPHFMFFGFFADSAGVTETACFPQLAVE